MRLNRFTIFKISLIILLLLTSCNQSKTPKSYKKTVLTIKVDKSYPQKVLLERLKLYLKLNGSELDYSEQSDELKISMPLFLSDQSLNKLLLSKGYITITKNDSVFFDSNSFEEFKFDMDFTGHRTINGVFKEEFVKNFESFKSSNITEQIHIKIDDEIVMSAKIASEISNGEIFIARESTRASKGFDLNITYCLISIPFNETSKTVITKKQLFLGESENGAEITPDYQILYAELQRILATNKESIISDLRLVNYNDMTNVEKQIDRIIENDLINYLIINDFQKLEELGYAMSSLIRTLENYEIEREKTAKLEDMIKKLEINKEKSD